MKKMIITAALVSLCASPALADTITKGQQATCKDANAISIEVANVANDGSGKDGYTNNDRGTASLVVWKSSNFTVITSYSIHYTKLYEVPRSLLV